MKVRDFGKKLSFLALVLGLVFSGGAIPGQMMMRMKSPMSRFSCMRMFGQTELFLKMVRRISI